MIISRKFSFDAAHLLPFYEGKCKKLHGHRWLVKVACEGEVKESTGMVIDFSELKLFCDDIKSQFDHTYLNEEFQNPTAEYICTNIWTQLKLWCGRNRIEPTYVRVWESEDSMVEIGE